MTTLPIFPLSVKQYHEMIRTGILTEQDRCELIRGRLVPKMTIGDDHAACVDRLTFLLPTLLGKAAAMRIQNPVVLADSEPEPDVSLVQLFSGKPRNKKPLRADVLLVIELADSSYDLDRNDKLPIYAENGIPEFWIIDLPQQAVDVFRQPQADGTYAFHDRVTGSDHAFHASASDFDGRRDAGFRVAPRISNVQAQGIGLTIYITNHLESISASAPSGMMKLE